MPTLGNQMFAQMPEWLARSAKRRFGTAIVSILRHQPDLTDLQVANKMMAWFEPEPLAIQDPTDTLLSWSTKPYRVPGGVAGFVYIHEAHVPYTGSSELWQLVCSESHYFKTRVTAGTKVAKLRTARPDRDVDQFRADVAADLERARLAATQQGPAIDAFRSLLHRDVEFCYGNQDFGGLRDHADTLNRQRFTLTKD